MIIYFNIILASNALALPTFCVDADVGVVGTGVDDDDDCIVLVLLVALESMFGGGIVVFSLLLLMLLLLYGVCICIVFIFGVLVDMGVIGVECKSLAVDGNDGAIESLVLLTLLL